MNTVLPVPTLSLLREVGAILWMHGRHFLFVLHRRVRGSTTWTSDLRHYGVSHLGRLSREATIQLSALVEDRCAADPVRETGSDCRIWGLHEDPNCQKWLDENFYQLALKPFEPRWRVATLMGNWVPNEIESAGSGGGWHRDSNYPQYKVMIMLSDVASARDGAFAFIPRSHRLLYVLKTFNRDVRWKIYKTRWTESEVADLSRSPSVVTGAAGDVFAFNGALLHCGLPNHGNQPRKALTFYLFPNGEAPPHLRTVGAA